MTLLRRFLTPVARLHARFIFARIAARHAKRIYRMEIASGVPHRVAVRVARAYGCRAAILQQSLPAPVQEIASVVDLDQYRNTHA